MQHMIMASTLTFSISAMMLQTPAASSHINFLTLFHLHKIGPSFVYWWMRSHHLQTSQRELSDRGLWYAELPKVLNPKNLALFTSDTICPLAIWIVFIRDANLEQSFFRVPKADGGHLHPESLVTSLVTPSPPLPPRKSNKQKHRHSKKLRIIKIICQSY